MAMVHGSLPPPEPLVLLIYATSNTSVLYTILDP